MRHVEALDVEDHRPQTSVELECSKGRPIHLDAHEVIDGIGLHSDAGRGSAALPDALVIDPA